MAKNKKQKDLVLKKHIKIYEHNLDLYSTPGMFCDTALGKSAILIGTGPSAQDILKYKSIIKNKFDVAIGVNFSIADFEDVLDFHLIMESKPTKIAKWMNDNHDFSLNLKRVFNQRSIRLFDPRFSFVKAKRGYYGNNFNVRKYSEDDGLLFAYKDIIGGATVMLQAMHFACILGCSSMYLIGAELYFRDQRYYFDNQEEHNLSIHKTICRPEYNPISIEHNGESVYSIETYIGSAMCMNKFILSECVPAGIKVFDFSGGLVTEAEQINIDSFMSGE
jgi:hypothetical protein